METTKKAVDEGEKSNDLSEGGRPQGDGRPQGSAPTLIKCTGCQEYKPATTDNFHKNKANEHRHGMDWVCKACKTTPGNKYYNGNRKRVRVGKKKISPCPLPRGRGSDLGRGSDGGGRAHGGGKDCSLLGKAFSSLQDAMRHDYQKINYGKEKQASMSVNIQPLFDEIETHAAEIRKICQFLVVLKERTGAEFELPEVGRYV